MVSVGKVTKLLSVGLLVALTGAFAQPAQGVVSLLGDIDGFGLAGAPVADGLHYVTDLGGAFFDDNRDAGDLANAPFTDNWTLTPASYVHSYSLAGLTPLVATLDFQQAGLDVGPYDVFVNGTMVGTIPDPVAPNENVSFTSSFNVPVGLLTGSDTVLLDSFQGDGYSIDYSRLTIQTEPNNTVVPEPITATLGLMGLGVLGMATRRRQA